MSDTSAEDNKSKRRQAKPLMRFVSAIDTFTDRAGVGISLTVLAIAGITLYEVIARFVFDSPTMWAHETVTLIFGAYVLLAGGYCLLHGRHVRVDILWGRLSPSKKALTDLITSVLPFIYVISLLCFVIPFAWQSSVTRETSTTIFGPPLWPNKIILVIAVFWLLVQLVMKFIHDINEVVRKYE